MNVLAVLIFSAVLATVWCNPDGPPLSACGTLMPGAYGHAASSDTGASPYRVTVTPTMYGPGDEIVVTVEKIDATAGTPDFRGIIVQARLKEGEPTPELPQGAFSNPSTNTKLISCTFADSTWVHANPMDKATASATWTAPTDASADMVFHASVVQVNSGGNSVFWTGLMADLTHNGATARPTTGMTKGTGGTTMKSTTKADAGYLRASLICTGLALFAIALVGRRL